MKTIEFGSAADTVLIQPVDNHDLAGMENEISLLRSMTARPFQLIAVKVDNWNHDLSPWNAPSVFGNGDFGDGAANLLEQIIEYCSSPDKTYYLGGYSLAGLFALWAACRTDRFAGAAAVSPSVWFPDFSAYLHANPIRTHSVYLSLGDREEHTRHPVMAKVGDCIREDYLHLQEQGVNTILEWNKGGHFTEPDQRIAKGFAWVMQQT